MATVKHVNKSQLKLWHIHPSSLEIVDLTFIIRASLYSYEYNQRDATI